MVISPKHAHSGHFEGTAKMPEPRELRHGGIVASLWLNTPGYTDSMHRIDLHSCIIDPAVITPSPLPAHGHGGTHPGGRQVLVGPLDYPTESPQGHGE
jgi:hypothetical protein